tara:strand:+ start:563 stop:1135 length:573 start_codon:yes stop_codon:yes gene_type:complete
MFAFKKKYFLIIESIKDLKLKNIKKTNKLIIIYRRTDKKIENINELEKFRKNCRLKSFKFFVANNLKLAVYLKADGLYISAHNRSYRYLYLKNLNYSLIGSAHCTEEIHLKKKQGCEQILMSRLFKVNYDSNKSFLGVVRFNNYSKMSKNLIALGGIKQSNLNTLKNLVCEGIAIMTEIKKKPAISSRLF